MNERFVYADHASTTALSPRAMEVMEKLHAEVYHNPSAIYGKGQRAREILDSSRAVCAAAIHAEPDEIYFTSGGTESDNLALFGAMKAASKSKKHLITTEIEHKAVLLPAMAIREGGDTVTFLHPDKAGLIDPAALEHVIDRETVMVSVMAANNEVGTVEPIGEIGAVCREKGVIFHTDAVQAVGHMPIDVKEQHITMLSASAHKFGGPKGVGFLYIQKGTPVSPLLLGGEQEKGLRSGTENVVGIAAMAAALEQAVQSMDHESSRLSALTDMIDGVMCSLSGVKKTGDAKKRLPGHLSYLIEGANGEALVHLLDMVGIAASAGAACSAGKEQPSHVLKAIGISDEAAACSLRLTLGRENTEADARYIMEMLPTIVRQMRQYA